MATDTKYIVFKRDEFVGYMSETMSIIDKSAEAAGYDGDPRGFPESITDAVVIRKQDVFAAPALDAYANSIAIAIEVLSSHGRGDSEMVKSLRDISDYFHAAAADSWETDRKIPTP